MIFQVQEDIRATFNATVWMAHNLYKICAMAQFLKYDRISRLVRLCISLENCLEPVFLQSDGLIFL